MKSFSDFAKKTQIAEAKITRDKFYKNEVYKKGEWVEYVMSLTPGQKVQKPAGTVAVKQTIPTDPKKDKMDHHEEKSLAQYAADAITTNLKREWRFDYSAKMANTDIKGLGAKGVGGGDAPGMKLAEPKGEEGKPDVKKVKHSCVTKVEHPEWGEGNCLTEMHTLDEEGNVSHYDIMFEHGLEKSVPADSFKVTREAVHEHVINQEVKSRRQIDLEPPAGPHGVNYLEPEVKTEETKPVKEKRSFSSFRSIAEKK